VGDLTPSALRWLASHHGVISTGTLRRCGIGEVTQRRLVERGILRTAERGVFTVASSLATFEQRCGVVCARHPAGFITGPSAGRLYGLRRMPATTAVHVAIRHGVHHLPSAGVRYRQTTVVRNVDRVLRSDGIVVASPARLAFDLAADLPRLDLLSAIEQLIGSGCVTGADLVAIERRLGHPARPGSGAFARMLAQLGARPVGDSHAEVTLADALERRGVPIERQSQVLAFPNGRSARIDLAVPSVKWGIELDVHPEHRSLEGHARDAGRVRHLHRAGWQIEQVSERDMEDVEALADELAALYRLRVEARTA
jgi:hypothetical protein